MSNVGESSRICLFNRVRLHSSLILALYIFSSTIRAWNNLFFPRLLGLVVMIAAFQAAERGSIPRVVISDLSFLLLLVSFWFTSDLEV